MGIKFVPEGIGKKGRFMRTAPKFLPEKNQLELEQWLAAVNAWYTEALYGPASDRISYFP